MPVIIGELEVVAAAPPSEPGPDAIQRALTAMDVVRIAERERERQARREAD